MPDQQSNQNASLKPRRSWQRFSIRTLLVMTALVANLVARWSSQRLDREIEQIVVKHGGYVGYAFDEGFWGSFREWCASLRLATGEMYVELSASSMTSLERAELFDRLGRRGDVQGIAVHHADDEVLWSIGDKLSGITYLHLDGWNVMDHGLVYLHRLTNLETLYLDNTSVTGRVFSELRGMSNLQYLEITSSQMTDDGVAKLIRLPKLWGISLEGNHHLTEATVHHLRQMKRLTHVDLVGTKITDDEAAKLWGLLPRLQNLNGGSRRSKASIASSNKPRSQTESTSRRP